MIYNRRVEFHVRPSLRDRLLNCVIQVSAKQRLDTKMTNLNEQTAPSPTDENTSNTRTKRAVMAEGAPSSGEPRKTTKKRWYEPFVEKLRHGFGGVA